MKKSFGRFLMALFFIGSLSLISACGGGGGGATGSGSSSYYAHWWCTSSQCAVIMGGNNGTAGPLSSLSACEQWRQTYILTSYCDTNPGGGNTPPPPAPTITSFSPTSGNARTNGGAQTGVTVSGTNFEAGAVVTINGHQVTATNVTKTQLQFIVPPMGSYTGPFSVTTSGGTATSSGSFKVTNDLNRVTWTGSTFVAVGTSGDILTSPDGITWTARASNVTTAHDNTLHGVSSSGTKVVAVGNNGITSMSTDNGVSWTGAESSMNRLRSVVSSGTGTMVAVGNGGIYSSPDGITWTFRSSAGLRYDVVWSGTKFVSVGDGNIFTSPDGTTWTSIAPSNVVYLRGIAWTGSKFTAVGDYYNQHSTDGVIWTGSASSSGLLGVTWSSAHSQFVSVGMGGVIYTSTDGISWSLRTSGTSNDLNGITWSGSQYVAVGNKSTILTSTDGVSWAKQATP